MLLEGAVAGTNYMRIDSGFLFLPQGPEAVLGQLEGCDTALFSRRHSNAKEEALQVGHQPRIQEACTASHSTAGFPPESRSMTTSLPTPYRGCTAVLSASSSNT